MKSEKYEMEFLEECVKWKSGGREIWMMVDIRKIAGLKIIRDQKEFHQICGGALKIGECAVKKKKILNGPVLLIIYDLMLSS